MSAPCRAGMGRGAWPPGPLLRVSHGATRLKSQAGARGSEITVTMPQVLTVASGLAAHKHIPAAHLFLGLPATAVSSLEKGLLQPFDHV